MLLSARRYTGVASNRPSIGKIEDMVKAVFIESQMMMPTLSREIERHTINLPH